jgi:hypothetical protein
VSGGHLKSALKQIIPLRIWRLVSRLYWWWFNRGKHQLHWFLSPQKRKSIRRLEQFRDHHRGERCFIIGNGPSLKHTDLSLLNGEVTFGLNRIYLLFDECNFQTTYFVAINTLVIEQCANEIRQLNLPKFITWRGRKWLSNDPGVCFLDTDYTPPATFSKDVTQRVFEGSTVTYVAMQLAFYMGFQEVILIGVDHSFTAKGPPNMAVISEGKDNDHFSSNYFGKGFRWQLPDLEASEAAYRMAKEAFESEGRRILDATIDGKLTVFPKVDYQRVVGRP